LYFDLNPLGANVEYTPHNQQNGIQWTLSQSRTRKGPTNLFEIEKVKIEIFTKKEGWVNDLLRFIKMY